MQSCVDALIQHRLPYGPVCRHNKAYLTIWKMGAPTKVKVLGWRCFNNILPSKEVLTKRGILANSNTNCIFCGTNTESLCHSLLHCHVSELVWREVANWIGFMNYKADNFKESFLIWCLEGKKNKVRKGKEGVMWLAIV